jgi:DNA-binding transcriptional ArsR family regulator/precorrin-6B methylase 2
VESIVQACKAAGDPNRLRILRILTRGPFNVAELTEMLGIGQSTVSRHLRLLADAGLVEVRRTGTWAFYSLRSALPDGFTGQLLEVLAGVLPQCGDGDQESVREALARRRRTTSAFFRTAAREWDHVRERALGPPAHLDRLFALVGRGGTVVDLGTGTGVLLEGLSPLADSVIGIDASPEMLEVAGRRVRENHLENTQLRLGALEHLPLGDGEADTTVANMVLHHVADVPAVLRDIQRVLAPQGRIVIADLTEHGEESFWQTLGAQWPGFRAEELREWLAAAGFVRIQCEELPAPASPNGAVRNGPRPAVLLVEATRGE